MKTNLLLKIWLSFIVMMGITFSAPQPGLAGSIDKGGGGNRVFDPYTGALAFVGTDAGHPVASLLSNPGLATAAQNSAAFVSSYASDMGLKSGTADLALQKTARDARGRASIRYQQVYQGIPVFASGVIVNTDASGGLSSLTSKTSPNLQVSITPTISADQAAAAAIKAIAKFDSLSAANLAAGTPELQIYDSRLVNPDGRAPRLVWTLVVYSQADQLSEMVLVDAANGGIALHFQQSDYSTSLPSQANANRLPGGFTLLSARTGFPSIHAHTPGQAQIEIYDLAGDDPSTVQTCPPSRTDCWPGFATVGSPPYGTSPYSLLCDQSNPAACTGDTDAVNAYNDALDFYNFFYNRFGLDGINNGATIRATVHYCAAPTAGCPSADPTVYQRVGWLNSLRLANYRDGVPAADDLAVHAMAFGLEENSVGLLLDGYQAGAIKQSLGDVWGELIDQTNGRGNDVATAKWLIGEDSPGGAVRNMKNPPAFLDPDKMSSTYYNMTDTSDETARANAGVNNKAVSLLVDGGAFNNKTISALGIHKVAAIYFEMETNLLTTASTYFDLYYGLRQACANLVGTVGITTVDCQQVDKATDATQMNMVKGATLTTVASYCPTGTTKASTDLFNDGDTNTLSPNWDSTSTPVTTDKWLPVTFDGSTGLQHFHAPDSVAANSEVLTMQTAAHLSLGTKPYLYFRQRTDFESNGATYYDGGRLEYSINGGSTWTDAAALYNAGKNYGGVIANGNLSNPEHGKSAFVGLAADYVPSRYYLGSLIGVSGNDVLFRWIVGTDDDATAANAGWDLDDIRIYNCVATPAVPTLSAPGNNALLTNNTPLLNWSDSVPDLEHYQLQVSTVSTFASTVIDLSTGTTSQYAVPGAVLDPNTKYYWHVRSINAAGLSKGWSATLYFRTPLPTPSLGSPSDASSLQTRRPDLTWSSITGATSYTFQISPNSLFSIITNTATVTGTTYAPTIDLARSTLYYWRVRANGANSSPFSAPFSFTTANGPSTPALLTPVTNTLVTTYTPTVTWGPVTLGSGAGSGVFNFSQIQISSDPLFNTAEVDDSSVHTNNASNTFTVSGGTPLSPNTTYYWRVRAFDDLVAPGNNYSGWSLVRTLRTPLAQPSLTFPADSTTIQTARPTYSWVSVPGATSYTIQVSKNSIFTALVTNTSAIASPTNSVYIPATDLLRGIQYWWRVKANGTNAGNYSAAFSFTTATTNPTAPLVLGPANGSLAISMTPTLSWRAVTPGTLPFAHFNVQVDDDPIFGSPAFDDNSVTTNLTPSSVMVSPALNPNTKYYWRVRAYDTGGNYGGWSLILSFRTPMSAPALSLPVDTNIEHTVRPDFAWGSVTGATTYTIQISTNNVTFSPLANTATITGTSYTPAIDLARSTHYYWRVRANGVNTSAFSAPFSFTTGNSPSTPLLASPASNALLVTYTPLLSWKAVTLGSGGFGHFEVQVDDDPLFGSPAFDDTSVTTNLTTNSVTVSPALNPNTKYYWRVKAFDTGTESSGWSTVWYFRTVILTPTGLTPTGATGTLLPLFDWNDVAGATSYTLQVSSSPVFSPLVFSKAIVGVSQFQTIANLPGGTLYWRVMAIGPNGPSSWSGTATIFDLLAPSPTITFTPTLTPTVTPTPTETPTPTP